jgi:hypothetical protein
MICSSQQILIRCSKGDEIVGALVTYRGGDIGLYIKGFGRKT